MTPRKTPGTLQSRITLQRNLFSILQTSFLGKICRLRVVLQTRLAFLAWGDFHTRSRFARSTIPEEKWGLLLIYKICVFRRPIKFPK